MVDVQQLLLVDMVVEAVVEQLPLVLL